MNAETGPDRRRFLRGALAAGAAFTLVGCGQDKEAAKDEEEVSPAEDLMREHGVLKRVLLVGALAVLFSLAADRAESTPSFNLVVSTGGITHLAVGETLQLRAYLPKVWRESTKPLGRGITWRVEPADVASVDAAGLMTALRPGRVLITVEHAKGTREVEGEPGVAQVTVVKELPDGRLPLLDSAPPLERFEVERDRSGFDQNRGLYAGVSTITWSAWITTAATPDHPLPWTLDAIPGRSGFNDDQGYQDLFGPDDFKRWQTNLTSGRLTITSWKDGIVSGRLEMRTSRGVALDTTFRAWFEDATGALARAAALPAPR